MYSLRMSFCSVPASFVKTAPGFSATARYIDQMTLAGGLMRMRVEPAYGIARNRGELDLALRIFFKSGLKSVLFPGRVFCGGFAMGGRSVRRGCGLRGAFGFFAHAHGSRGRNQTSKQIGTEFNAIRKVVQGQEGRDDTAGKRPTAGATSRQEKKPARSEHPDRPEKLSCQITFGRA